MFTRSQHGHKDWMHAGNTAQCEEHNPRLSVVVERINYLCGNSWGESSRFETRPTEAVFTDREVRGHAEQTCGRCQAAGSESWWAPGRRMIRDLLQLFLQSHAVSHMYHWHGGSMYKTSKQKYKQIKQNSLATTSQRPKDCVCAWPLIDP